jgi:hypothetical protein
MVTDPCTDVVVTVMLPAINYHLSAAMLAIAEAPAAEVNLMQ